MEPGNRAETAVTAVALGLMLVHDWAPVAFGVYWAHHSWVNHFDSGTMARIAFSVGAGVLGYLCILLAISLLYQGAGMISAIARKK